MIARVAKILILAMLLGSSSAGAKEPEEKKVGYSVTKWVYKRLTEAHELIEKNKYQKALKVMNSMKGRARLNPHEKALMWQTFGYIYANMEKVPKAIESFEKCLAIGALPEQTKLDLQFSLGQLYMANRQFAKAVKALNDWIGKVKNPSPEAKYLLAMAYTQNKKWKKALYWIQQALAGVRRPKESWLQLVLSIQYELKHYGEMAKILERLVARFPKKAYWMQLSSVYTEIKQENRAMAVLELAYMQNMLTSHSELMNLVSLFLHHGIPVKAARVLERGLKNGQIKKSEQTLTLLGDSWMRAREFELAARPLGQAAQIAEKGDLWVRVAQIHMEREQWTRATTALQSALKKGGLTSRGNAYLFLGICHFNTGRIAAAKRAFNQALEHKRSRRSAEQWLKTLTLKTRAKSQ
jgi:tetratricopeptide (TPR) repeat protein